jgi:Ca2+/H+ antiporter
MNKNFFAGVEEVVSRLISAFITTVFFLVYVAAKDTADVTLNWSGLLVVLVIFWLVYEFLAYCLYLIFVYFSRQTQQSKIETVKENDSVESDDKV